MKEPPSRILQGTAVFHTNILPVYGFDSIRILLVRGEILPNTGNAPEISIRWILVCELLVCTFAPLKDIGGCCLAAFATSEREIPIPKEIRPDGS